MEGGDCRDLRRFDHKKAQESRPKERGTERRNRKKAQKERKKEKKEGAWTYESTGVKVNLHGPRPCRCRCPAELRAGPPLARPPGGAACRERRSAGTRAWGTSSRDKMRVRGKKRRRAQTSVKKEHSLCRFISQGSVLVDQIDQVKRAEKVKSIDRRGETHTHTNTENRHVNN